MPPPVVPNDWAHVVSVNDAPETSLMRVPPQELTNGSDAGYSTCAAPSPCPQSEPLSPEAANTVTPSAAASWNVWFTALIACCVHVKPSIPSNSGQPQLIESTEGLFVASCTELVITSTQ